MRDIKGYIRECSRNMVNLIKENKLEKEYKKLRGKLKKRGLSIYLYKDWTYEPEISTAFYCGELFDKDEGLVFVSSDGTLKGIFDNIEDYLLYE